MTYVSDKNNITSVNDIQKRTHEKSELALLSDYVRWEEEDGKYKWGKTDKEYNCDEYNMWLIDTDDTVVSLDWGYLMIFEIKHLNTLVNLHTLNLSNNNITNITGLNNLVNLHKLWLTDNKITKIQGMDTLVNLEILDLHDNKITEIKNIGNLVNLQKLYLHDNNIREIKNIDNLVNLQELNLSCNKIKEIKNIDKLILLQDLDVDENYIKEIPLTILQNTMLVNFSHDVYPLNPLIRNFLNINKATYQTIE